ncbi:MAG: hypothetical protein ACYC3X_30920 [Pirellulaceae bacterium]
MPALQQIEEQGTANGRNEPQIDEQGTAEVSSEECSAGVHFRSHCCGSLFVRLVLRLVEESQEKRKLYGMLTQESSVLSISPPYFTFLRFLVRQSAVQFVNLRFLVLLFPLLRKSERDIP